MTLLLLLLTMAAAPPPQVDAAPQADESLACVSLEVQPNDIVRFGRSRAWSARDVTSLEFRGRVTPPAAQRRLELRVLTPQGHLYQTLVADPRGHRVSASRGLRMRGRGRVLATMPVAGTSVTQRGLFGRWSVVPHFDGESRPCGPAVAFDLQP
jgi:hypothetical protein